MARVELGRVPGRNGCGIGGGFLCDACGESYCDSCAEYADDGVAICPTCLLAGEDEDFDAAPLRLEDERRLTDRWNV